MRPAFDEVVRPDMVGPTGAKPDAGAVVQPQPAALGLLLGDLQPLPPPDPLHALGIHQRKRQREATLLRLVKLAELGPV
jgi:hypothetical protein